jgi:CheY-like chemotaxis protein
MSAEQNVTEVPVHPASQTSDQSDNDSYGGSGGYELDENGQRVPHGMGISKSSRRRRRKRKGKSGDAAASQGGDATLSGAAEGEAQASLPLNAAPVAANGATQPPQAFRQNNQQQGRSFGGQQQNGHQNNGGGQNAQNGQNAPGGTKRWKKKFRDRDRQRGDNGGQQGQQNFGSNNGGGHQQNGGGFRGPDTHQPGNSVSGFKRKGGFGGKQNNGGGGGGSRNGFVGPMDHSYRVVNGNVFDVPPATIEVYGNGGGGYSGGRGRGYAAQSDSQPIDYSQGRVIPIAEGTPTRIYFFIDDLFFTAKIQETARKLGVKVAFVKNEKEQIAALTAAENEDHPGLIVFDLNNANAKPMTLIPKLKAKLKKTTSIIGFLSHLQGDLKAKAMEAGCDTVMPRAAFSQNLPNLLRRYGIEEVDEPNFNQ